MNMQQVYQLVNTVTSEILGDSVIVNEDLSNVVDLGKAFENAYSLDNYVKSLVDHIGRVVFVNRSYPGRAPSVLMDGWEYGSILEKVKSDIPDAVENSSWDLNDGQSYDPFVFHKPTVTAKFFNDRTTFEVDRSITRRQVKSAFSSAVQMNGLISMILTEIENSITLKTDALIMRTINTGIAETLAGEFPSGTYSGGSGVRAVNLLYLYNQRMGTTLTAAAAMFDPAFMRFAAFTVKTYIRRMQDMSRLFNAGGTARFTPADRMHVVMLDEFKSATDVYLLDGLNQFKTDNLRIPGNMETVSFWQGSGSGYAFTDTSKIMVTTPSDHTVTASGILGVVFDRDALGVTNIDRSVEVEYSKKAQFWNYFYKHEAGYFLDLDENFVVFYIA